MAIATIAGLNVIHGTLFIPRIGAWHADLVIDTSQDLVGPQTLTITANGVTQTWLGTVFREGTFVGRLSIRFVAGANGLRTTIPAKYFRNCTLQLPLSDTLTACGEVLSTTSDATTMQTALGRWTRLNDQAGSAIDALADQVSASWRFLPNGQFWMGPETYPTITVDPNLVVITKYDPILLRHEVAMDLPYMLPGQIWNGRKVSYVEYGIEATKMRSHVFYERTS
jgi:hypothetical protein